MFRNHERKWKILFGFVDAFLTAAAFALAYELRQSLPLSLQFFLLPGMRAALLAFCVVTWVVSGYWLNVYARFDSVVVSRILRDSFRQAGCGALALIILVFSVKIDISRVFLGGFVVLSWTLLVAFRLSARTFMPSISRHFGAERNVFIVGTGQRARDLARSLEPYRRYGLEILGFLAVSSPKEQGEIEIEKGERYPVFPLDDLRSVLAKKFIIDEVYFAADNDELADLEDAFRWCDEEGVCRRIAADFFPRVTGYIALEQLGSTPLLTFSGAPGDDALLLTKRAIDVVLSALGIVVLSPVFLVVALLVKLTSKGPVIFRQSRCGLNGRMFTCYKFRTMVQDAEQRLHEVKHLNQREIVTKIPNDPRLTPIGRWLRKFSLDELPQLFNVVRGDMSLVGPRPAIPSEVAQYQRWQRRRLRMRPGLTCLWALRGRDKVDFEAWMRLDLQYIDNWSLGLDARIILMTIPNVLSGRGAS
jgi:exopolysaccharide biosynthesis polyprenyl glycosylphosphotransferase